MLAERQFAVLGTADVLLEAGVRILQYRHKRDWTQTHFDEAKRLSEMCQDAGVLFVLNDRADFAKLLRCALHLGQEDMSPTAARPIVSDEVIGYSTHNVVQLKLGDTEPVEYLSVGPIFATTSKLRPDPVVGIEGLKAVRALTKKQLCAIGGITLENVKEVFAAKADSVALISGYLPEKFEKKALRAKVTEWLAV